MSLSLLTTKLYMPPASAKLVPRPRLLRQLDEGLRLGQRLTLASAPAGFGKTTLLSEWLRQVERPVAWLSLDDGDNDPVRFFAYLLAALQRIDPDIGQTAETMLTAPQPPPPEPLVASLTNDIAETTQRFILVLDDYHLIEAPPIHDTVSFLLDHMPPPPGGMHLVIATRADPPLPIARLRARGQLNELHVADLRFTAEEAAEFLNRVMGLDLSVEDLAALEERTEGWIAGLQMAALSMRGRVDVGAFVRAFTGSHRYIFDYLGDEVLRQQPDDVGQFLLQTAILDRLTAPLCDAVIEGAGLDLEPDGSQAMLEYLESNNLFVVPLDDERRWYRYHHLFADLLRHRLRQEQPDLEPELHRRACEWYEQNEWLSAALSHALASGNDERVARLVEENSMAMMTRGMSAALLRWLNSLPQEIVRSRPWLCVAHAWVLAYGGQLDAIETPLQDAESASEGLEEGAQKVRIAGHIAAIRMFAVFLEGNLDPAIELGRQALQQLPETDLRVRGFVASHVASALRWRGDLAAAAQASAEVIALSQPAGEDQVAAEAFCIQAGTQILQGRLHDAAASCREAMRLADECFQRSRRSLHVTSLAYARLALVHLEWDDVDTATRYAREGITLAEKWGTADMLLVSYREVVHTLQASGDAEGALDAVRQGMRVARGMSLWVRADMAAERAKLWLTQGNLPAALQWAADSGLTTRDKIPFHREKEYRIFAQILIAQGHAAQALSLLAPLADMLETLQANHSLIAARVLQALAFQEHGESAQAVSSLVHALSLAEPGGYVRTFVDEGEPMARLLRCALAQGIAPSYVSKLLTAFGESTRPASPAAQALVEPLTERELEVLRLIAAGLSNREIAQELVVAVSTVKTHINHVYGKLAAKSRIQAVAKAQALGLL